MSLVSLSDALASVAASLAPSIVAVRDAGSTRSSGLVLSADRVLTTAHTLTDREDPLGITTADGRELPARLVGTDPTTDLALLAVDDAGLVPAGFRDPTAVRPGELALLVGHGPRLHLGVVAATGGPWRTRRGAEVEAWVEVDATLVPALVGGATVDAEGRVIGLSTPGLTRVGAILPEATLRRVAARIEARGTVVPGWLGVRFTRGTLPAALASAVGQAEVLLVAHALPDGPAARAGWQTGDAVLAVDGVPARDVRTLFGQLADAGAGAEVTATLLRGGQEVQVATALGERPERRSRWGCGPRGC